MIWKGFRKFLPNFHPLLNSRSCKFTARRMSTRAPKEISIPIPQGYIAGKIWNEGGGSPLLGLHGWMDNAGTWDNVAPLLPEDVSLISIDFPGHGLSPIPKLAAGFSFLDLVLVIERIVQHFGWEEINFLGHSMGGCAAMLYAATFPNKVKKLMMVDLVKPISVEPPMQPTRTAEAIEGLLATEKKIGADPTYDYETIVEKMIKGYNESLTEDSAKTLLKRGSKQHENGQYSFSYDRRIKLGNLLSLTFDQQKAFARNIECEMMIIKASKGPIYEDKALYDEIIAIYQEKAKVFKYVTVPGTHHVHMNDPEVVAKLICDFLSNTV